MTFTGHPKPKRLVLADDWPAGIYPLRKEVPYNLEPPAAEDVAYRLDEAPPGTTVVPIGPFHSSLHEPEHFAVYVDGETIKGCDYRGFMTHRGIEKLCQTQVSYNEIPFVAERICGICGVGPRRLLRAGGRGGRGPQDLAAGRVHPHHHARDRAPPLAPPLARHRRPPHRLRHGLHAGLADPGKDHVALRADHRQPQDLRHDPHRRRPPRHHPGDPGRDRGPPRRPSRKRSSSSRTRSSATPPSTAAPRASATCPRRRRPAGA